MKLHSYLFAAMLLAGAAGAQAMPGAKNSDAGCLPNFETYADYNPAVLDRNYAAALTSECDGVVESALGYAIKMKLVWPDKQFPKVERAARELSMEGRSIAIRYRALLTNMVLDNVQTFNVSDCIECETPEAMFQAVAARLQQTALSAK